MKRSRVLGRIPKLLGSCSQLSGTVYLLPLTSLRTPWDCQMFGEHNVLWVPIADFHLAEEVQLINQILPFFIEGTLYQEKTVVHCSGGVGRTGHVLAAWLVGCRGMSNEEAIAAVKRQGRNARESRDKQLDTLLDRCRDAFSQIE